MSKCVEKLIDENYRWYFFQLNSVPQMYGLVSPTTRDGQILTRPGFTICYPLVEVIQRGPGGQQQRMLAPLTLTTRFVPYWTHTEISVPTTSLLFFIKLEEADIIKNLTEYARIMYKKPTDPNIVLANEGDLAAINKAANKGKGIIEA